MLDSDANTVKDQVLAAGLSSDGDAKSSTDNPTYTKADIDKAISDALSRRGHELARESKAKADALVAEKNQDIQKLQDRLDELELAGVDKDNPEATTLFQIKKELRNVKAGLRQAEIDKANLAEKAEKADRYEQLEATRKVAAKYENIDPVDLIGKTDEQIDAFCKRYGKLKDAASPEDSNHVPDSGRTSGGTVDVSKLSPSEKIHLGVSRQSKQRK